MALTTIPSELSSVSGISDSSSSTAITIDSSQNVTFAGNITTGSNTISGVLSSVTGSIGSAATATTQAASDNSTKLATTAYVTTALANLVDSAPGTLNTLNELAAALGDDANFSTTVTNSIAAKLPLAGGTLTGDLDIKGGATALSVYRTLAIASDTQSEITLGSQDLSSNYVDAVKIRGLLKANKTDGELSFYTLASSSLTERMRIDSSGNVGIGTTSPGTPLEVRTSSDTEIAAIRTGSVSAKLGAFASGESRLTSAGNSAFLTFYTGTSSAEAMRIDSSGNVLVGATTTTNLSDGTGNDGVHLNPSGTVAAARTSNVTAVFNRLSSDGEIVRFNKDGTTVGSIGSISSDLYIAESNVGLRFDGENNQILPASTTASTDGTCNLGASSARFNNLYLSGSMNTATGVRVLDSSSLAGGIFKEKTVAGTGSSNDLSIFAEGISNGGSIHFMTGGSADKKVTIDSSGTLNISASTSTHGLSFGAYLPSAGQTILTYHDGNTRSGLGIVPGVHRMFTNTGAVLSFGEISTSDGSTYSERMRIDANGNVGIGTTSPTYPLDVTANSSAQAIKVRGRSDNIGELNFTNNAGNSTYAQIQSLPGELKIKAIASIPLTLYTDNTERVRIKSNGQVGIGTTTPGSLLDVGGGGAGAIARFKGGNNNQVNISHASNSSWGLLLTNSDHTNVGGYHVSTSGNNNSCAVVNVNDDALHFATDNTHRMTIDHNGKVCIGSTSPNGKLDVIDSAYGVTYPIVVNNTLAGFNGRGAGIRFNNGSTNQTAIFYYHYGTTASTFFDADLFRYRNLSSGATLMELNSSGNASLTGSLTQNTSDERLKDNITEIPNAIDKIKELKGVTFEWQGNGAKDFPHIDGTKDMGVIAQDVQKVLPEAVQAAPFDLEKEMEENSDGSFTEKLTSKSGEDYLTVHYEKLIPVLIQGMKEQQALIEALQTKVAALEGE